MPENSTASFSGAKREALKSRVFVLFFLSGVAALLYQLLWQRSLFTIYGTNSESITVIVAVFLLGLGIGSLIGGALSKRRETEALRLFAMAETGIGVFGLVSLPLLSFLAESTAGVSAAVGGLLAFAAVLIPTTLMGATLPLLVAYLVKLEPHIGSAVGDLYYMNTLGSALGCILAAVVLFQLLGLSGTVVLAACLNFIVVGLAVSTIRREGKVEPEPQAEQGAGA